MLEPYGQPPATGGITGDRNADLTFQLRAWSRQNDLGKSFDSSTGFTLPNGADRSPDAAWVRRDGPKTGPKGHRWDALTPEEQERFVPLCPDFVVKLMSSSDSLERTQQKMLEYQENGAQLGWLINRKRRQVEVYRLGHAVEVLEAPETLSGEGVLPGFMLDLGPIW